MKFLAFSQTKFGGGTPEAVPLWRDTMGQKARAGREFLFPKPLFLPAPPERFFSEVRVGIFSEKSSDFVQETQQFSASQNR